MSDLSREPINFVITGSAGFAGMKSVVHIYDPRDPKGTMQRHEVAEGTPVEVPAGWVVSLPSTVAPDATVGFDAREKDYGI